MVRVEADDGTELFVRDFGSGDPIVFVHGWPLNHRMFEYQFERLASEGLIVSTASVTRRNRPTTTAKGDSLRSDDTTASRARRRLAPESDRLAGVFG